MRLSALLSMIPDEIARIVVSRVNKFLNYRPSSAPLLSGDTYRSIADKIFDETHRCKGNEIKHNDIVFISSNMLDMFRLEMKTVVNSFILLTHQGDINIDEKYKDIAENKYVIKWFAQNCLLAHEKVIPIPIGLEDRWRHNNGVVCRYTRKNAPSIPRVAVAFTLGTNLEKRIACYKALKLSSIADELEQPLNNRLYISKARKYMFIASPPGNGADCHRTWEALYINSIPIVEDNYMNRYLKNLGLPLWLVTDWDEVAEMTENNLCKKYREVMNDSNRDSAFTRYWESIILMTKGK